MKNKLKKILFITLLLIPNIVFASEGESDMDIVAAIFMEAFVSLHMSFFVLKPLSAMFFKENSKKGFWIMFATRAAVLLFFDFFITTNIAVIDFFAVFVGAFLVVPICSAITRTPINRKSNQVIASKNIIQTIPQQDPIKGIELKCAKCNTTLQISDKYCPTCGAPFDGNNVVVSQNTDAIVQVSPKVTVLLGDFDKVYSLTENELVEEFINRELIKAGIDKSAKLIPSDILKRKNILNIIFSILLFVFVTLIFFHFPIATYIVAIVVLFIFYKVTRNYDLVKYLKKQLKARPKEKISNIVMSTKNTLVIDNTRRHFAVCLLIAVILPIIIFYNPKIIYEKVDGGYAVRYYIWGVSNFKTATIPETYKDENVVSLRGNTFSNMFFLESVELPNSITEIRGQAFKNCYKLSNVNMPKKLEYLGGGAFYNASSITEIELPDTLTELGGEAFYNATSLKYIKLSNNLEEIRGDSFKYCTSLKSITIPDSVTRIGAHAFYGASSLSEVLITENSDLKEIGSSAFRRCSSLRNIIIPNKTYVNERAFKESPTIIKRYDSIKKEIVEDQESIQNEKKEKKKKEIEWLKEDIQNNIIEMIIDNGQKRESNYIMFHANYSKNVIVINDYEILMTYNPSISADKTGAALLFDVDNYNKHNSNFDIGVDYYDKNYIKIGSCNEKTNLNENYTYEYINCIFENNETNATVNDIRYYKIYIENYNIK